ncbi:MAG: ATPase [Bacillota bacterium]|nr:ATPase [Bacillota bacterium]
MKGKIINVFPEGITSQGFCSFYNYILQNLKLIIFVKNGSLIGNSLIFKRIGIYFNEKGYDIEYHHCSLDPDKLWAVVIKSLNIALIDSSITNEKNHFCLDCEFETIDVNECFNKQYFKQNQKFISEIYKNFSICMNRSYMYLKAANQIHNNLANINTLALNISKINNLKQNLKNKIFISSKCCPKFKRHLFTTAFSSEGIVTYADSNYINYENKYVLNGNAGTGKTNILKYIAEEAFIRGYTVEIYHNPLLPSKIEHILIPDINTAVMSSNELNNISFDGLQLYLGNFLDCSIIIKNKEEMDVDNNNYKILINHSLKLMAESKLIYDEIDKYYVMDINFDKVLKTIDMLVCKIEFIEKINCNQIHP